MKEWNNSINAYVNETKLPSPCDLTRDQIQNIVNIICPNSIFLNDVTKEVNHNELTFHVIDCNIKNNHKLYKVTINSNFEIEIGYTLREGITHLVRVDNYVAYSKYINNLFPHIEVYENNMQLYRIAKYELNWWSYDKLLSKCLLYDNIANKYSKEEIIEALAENYANGYIDIDF